MDCSDAKDRLMAVLDRELAPEELDAAMAHIRTCESCRHAFEDLTSLKEVISKMPVEEPTEKEWADLWPAIYCRITRGAGWSLFIISSVILILYGIYAFLTLPGLAALQKVLVMGVLLGLASLFASVAIERYHESKTDKYKEVEK